MTNPLVRKQGENRVQPKELNIDFWSNTKPINFFHWQWLAFFSPLNWNDKYNMCIIVKSLKLRMKYQTIFYRATQKATNLSLTVVTLFVITNLPYVVDEFIR